VRRRTFRQLRAAAESSYHHHVYVVLLDPAAARVRKLLRGNPQRDPAKPCVYVGMTGLAPEERFWNHRHGIKAAWIVRRYGVKLLPDLFEHLNPMPFEAAAQMEKDLAEDLRSQGYTVAGGT
jgi:predicted GIY-YIG superfamily endonuclease